MIHDTASPHGPQATGLADQILTFLHHVLGSVTAQDPATEPRGRGRPRELSTDHLLLAMLLAILHGFTGFACVWRLITWSGVSTFPLLDLTRAAVRKRLLTQSLDHWHDVLHRVSTALLPLTHAIQDQTLAPFASQVLAVDQSTLDAVRRTCQDVRQESAESPRLLVGKLAGLFDVRRQQWVRLLFRDDVFANEKLHLQDLLSGLLPDTLLLMDLGYFSFPLFDWLTDQQLWWLTRLREKTSFTRVHVFLEQGSTLDALIWLGAYRANQTKHLVRLIQFHHQGVLYQYVTNVRDPDLLTMSEAARLYARRWDIELAFKALKGALGISLWWSSHPVLVLQQLFGALILAQILHALHLQVAAEAGVELFDVSFPVLTTLLAQAPSRLSPQTLIAVLLAKGRRQGLLRPSRRCAIQVPALLTSYVPAPADLPTTRPPRYDVRKCQPRSLRPCFLPRFCSFFLI